MPLSSNRRLARGRRRPRRTIEVPLGLDDFSDLDEMVAMLCRWAVHMPWAVEVPSMEAHDLVHRFAIDCPDLACHRLWFAIDAGSDELEDGPVVIVVLARRLADRGAAVGWAARIAELDGDRAFVAVALPTTDSELCALQGLLQVAYAAGFDGPQGRSDACSR